MKFWHHHAGVSVPDLEASIAWYRDVLGFDVEWRMTFAHIPAEVAMLKNGPLRVEIFQPEGGAPLPDDRRHPQGDIRTHGNKHFSFMVENVDALVAEFQQRGVDIAWTRRNANGALAYIRDNAGNLIEFVEGRRPEGEAAL